MRRVLILALCFSICHSSAMALSGRFGAECSPSYAINSVYSRTKPALCDQGGALALHFGGAYHLVLQEHCNLSLGLSYALARLSVAREASESVPPIDKTYFLRYILIPVLCRFYTSEVMIDTSFYIKLGALLSINLPTRSATPSDSPPPAGFTKRALGCFVLLGGGVKYDFSLTNSLVVGISYCWDVPGVIYKKNATNGLTNYNCHNNFICLDLCCLF